jgi:hypothetical protein
MAKIDAAARRESGETDAQARAARVDGRATITRGVTP